MSTTTEQPSASTTEPNTEPPAPYPPGHPDAVEAGCICPPWINCDGAGLRTVVFAEPEPDEYLMHPDCRLHGSL